MRRAGGGRAGQTHLVEVVLAAPAPRTGGGDRPPLWVQRTAWLSSGPDMQAGETVKHISCLRFDRAVVAPVP